MAPHDHRSTRRHGVLLATFLAAVTLVPAAFALTHGGGQSSAVTGRLLAKHSDDFAHGRSSISFVVQSAAGETAVDVSQQQAGPLLGRQVRATKRADGSTELVAADGTASPSGLSAAAAAVTQKRVAVLLINFSNDTRTPWTAAQVRTVAFDDPSQSVATYFRQSTWGQIEMSGDVFGWYTLPDTNTSCSYSAWGTSANAAAAAAGVDLNQYQHVVYAFPSTSACGWAGLAYMPGRYSWLNNAGTSLRVMAHELAHNFGTHHASTMTCTEGGARVPLTVSGSCSSSEYGDPYSVMGSSSRYTPTNVSRGNFGVLQPANTLTVTTSGDYLLKPIDPYEPSGVQSLRVRRTTSTYLTMEFRQSDGSYFATYSASDPVANGVSVRVAYDYTTRSQTQLVDTTPATTSFDDAPLAVGQTLVDPLTGVSLTTLSVGPGGAVVRVSFAPDTSPPTQPPGLTASALDASRVALSWGASSDNMGVAGYRILRDGTLVATVTGTGFTDTGLAAATSYGYQVVAFDAAGNVSAAATASATTLTSDTQPPTAPGSLSAAVNKRKVTLQWGASTDNVAVTGYRVYRGGVLVASVASSSRSYLNTGVPRGTHTYGVEAFDAAGNTGIRATTSATVR
jgi:chitodextrinase